MRLLHVASSYPLSDGDEHAPFMEEMLEALANRGHEVAVLVPRVKGLVEGRRNGVEVIGVPYAPSSLQVWGYGRSLGAKSRLRVVAVAVTPVAMAAMGRALRRQIKTRRPDVVHLHWLIPQGVLSLVVPRQIPIVISLHGADVRYAAGSLAPVARRVVDRAGAVVAASSGVIDEVSQAVPGLKEKAVVIPHGANEKLFYPRDRDEARFELGVAHDGPIILGVGRLVPKKGFRYLIHAMGDLADGSAHLHLVGEGPERPLLEGTVPAHLRDRVHFEGSKSRADVAAWIAASDLVAIPSAPERGDVDTGPVVLLEALASGRPVVATQVGMASSVIEEGVNGSLLESSDPAMIAAAMDAVLALTDSLGEGAFRSSSIIGDWARAAEEYESVYVELLRRATSRG
jgi:glycosyltransferase involved in cell wall biosynthesis